jgi:hypothetical protein
VRDARRQQKNLARTHAYQPPPTLLDDWQLHLAVVLPEEFGAGLDVEVGSRVWPAHAHD